MFGFLTMSVQSLCFSPTSSESLLLRGGNNWFHCHGSIGMLRVGVIIFNLKPTYHWFKHIYEGKKNGQITYYIIKIQDESLSDNRTSFADFTFFFFQTQNNY